jgi:hypothetical protein
MEAQGFRYHPDQLLYSPDAEATREDEESEPLLADLQKSLRCPLGKLAREFAENRDAQNGDLLARHSLRVQLPRRFVVMNIVSADDRIDPELMGIEVSGDREDRRSDATRRILSEIEMNGRK